MTAQLNPRGDVAVLVPAAGAGVRLGPGRPKALRLLGGEPLLVHAVRRLAAAPVRAHHRGGRPGRRGRRRCASCSPPVAPVTVVPGGATGRRRWPPRCAAVPAGPGDRPGARRRPGARPARAGRVGRGGGPGRHDAVIPVLPVVDTIKEVAADGGGARHRRPVRAAGGADAAGLPPGGAGGRARRGRRRRSPTTPGLVEKQGVRGVLRPRLRVRPEDHPPVRPGAGRAPAWRAGRV